MQAIRWSCLGLALFASALAVTSAHAWNMGPSMGGGAASSAASSAAAAAAAAARGAAGAAGNAASSAVYGARSGAGGSGQGGDDGGGDGGLPSSLNPTAEDAANALNAAVKLGLVDPSEVPGLLFGGGGGTAPGGGGGGTAPGYVQGSGILQALIDSQPDPAASPAAQQAVTDAQNAYDAAMQALQNEQNLGTMVWNTRFNGPGDWGTELTPAQVETVMNQGQNGAAGAPGVPPGSDENTIWRNWVNSVHPALVNEALDRVRQAEARLQQAQAALGTN